MWGLSGCNIHHPNDGQGWFSWSGCLGRCLLPPFTTPHMHPSWSWTLSQRGQPVPIEENLPWERSTVLRLRIYEQLRSTAITSKTSSNIGAASLKDGPKQFLPLDIHVLVQSSPILHEGCSVWQTELGRSNDVSFLRPDHKRYYGICLILPWITGFGGNQLPCGEDI